MWDHMARGNSLVDSISGTLGLGTTNVTFAEQELAIEVGEINGVHVYDVNVGESHVGTVFQELTAQATSSNDQYLNLSQLLQCFFSFKRHINSLAILLFGKQNWLRSNTRFKVFLCK